MTFLDDRLIAESGLELARIVEADEFEFGQERVRKTRVDDIDDEGFTLAYAVWN